MARGILFVISAPSGTGTSSVAKRVLSAVPGIRFSVSYTTRPRRAGDSPTEIETGELESLVRKEVERLIKSTINENIQKMIREILVQEVEKAIVREMEKLKRD